MKKFIYYTLFFFILILVGCTKTEKKISKFDFTGSKDASLIRGYNYTPANRHHVDTWLNYDSTTIKFDLNLAKSLNLNQVRVFVPYAVFSKDKEALPSKLRHFIRECHKRNIGVMPVVGSGPWIGDTTLRRQAKEWVKFLVDAVANEPGLAMWDAMNEPDWPTTPSELVLSKSENAKFMAKMFHEFDKNTPVTIGWAFVDGMIESADDVDVLQFHDYMPTREQIRNSINKAKEFAVKVKKPLIDGELGCIARANPYDVTLQEHMNAKVGWYIWELMIVRKGWGIVHGVFYEDGTVRDPSIAAAMMGFFRKRTSDILPSVPDKEGMVTKVTDQAAKWLENTEASWTEGLDIAETSANLLEAGELTAMIIPPSQEVELLRQGKEDKKALKDLIVKFKKQLEPYKLPRDTKN